MLNRGPGLTCDGVIPVVNNKWSGNSSFASEGEV